MGRLGDRRAGAKARSALCSARLTYAHGRCVIALSNNGSKQPAAILQAQGAVRPALAHERAAAGRGGAEAAARPLTRAQRAARRQDGATEEPLYFMAVRPCGANPQETRPGTVFAKRAAGGM